MDANERNDLQQELEALRKKIDELEKKRTRASLNRGGKVAKLCDLAAIAVAVVVMYFGGGKITNDALAIVGVVCVAAAIAFSVFLKMRDGKKITEIDVELDALYTRRDEIINIFREANK